MPTSGPVDGNDQVEGPGVVDLNASRASLFVQLLCPPLPIVCTDFNGLERISSSHDLLSCMFGRLLQINNRAAFKGAYVADGFDGDWQSHLLLGKHATDLLRALVSVTSENEAHPQSLLEMMQVHFYTYTREIVTLAMGYDLFTTGCPDAKIPKTQDVRFLLDPKRINMTTHRSMVMSTADFYCSLLCFRCGATDQETAACKRNLPMKYDIILLRCMNLIRDLAPEILQGELERHGLELGGRIPGGPQ